MAEQFTLSGEWAPSHWPEKAPRPAPSVLILHRTYGRTLGEQCKRCVHFRRERHSSKVYFKCAKYRHSHGPATDWRANWPACGLWQRGETL